MIIIGPPGVGKGEVRKRFASTHECIEVKALIKKKMVADSEYRNRAMEIIASGDLLPDEMINPLLRAHLEMAPSFHPVMIDGSCRNLAQTKFLRNLLLGMNFEPIFLVFEDPNDDDEGSNLYHLCRERLSIRIDESVNTGEVRSDDTVDTHRKRFLDYWMEIDHVEAYLSRKSSNVFYIDATMSKNEVFTQVSLHTGVTSDLSKV